MDKQWLSVDGVRKYIPVSRATIGRWCNDPKYAHLGFPKPFILGSRLLFDHAAIQEFMLKYYKR